MPATWHGLTRHWLAQGGTGKSAPFATQPRQQLSTSLHSLSTLQGTPPSGIPTSAGASRPPSSFAPAAPPEPAVPPAPPVPPVPPVVLPVVVLVVTPVERVPPPDVVV